MDILNQSAFDIDLNLDPLWCAWFSGWVDGEGCFMTTASKTDASMSCTLSVVARDDDASLFHSVREILKCGSIIMRPAYKTSNPHIEWYCRNLSACRHILIPLLDKYPLHSKKSRDYEIWRKIVLSIYDGQHLNGNRNCILGLRQELKDIKKYITVVSDGNIPKVCVDDAWYSWFSGWIDGEGSFLAVQNKTNRHIACSLSVGVRDDDSMLIEEVKNALGCGRIYSVPARGRHNPSTLWHCTDIYGCREILVPIFDQYSLRSKKNKDYKIWRELVMSISGGLHLDGNRDYVLGLRNQLKAIRKYKSHLLE